MRRQTESGKDYAKSILLEFILIQAGVTLAMGIIGTMFARDIAPGYPILFVPFVFAGIGVLPGILLNSRKELTVRQLAMRKVLHLLLMEGIVLGINYMTGALFRVEIVVGLVISVLLIYIFVSAVQLLYDKRSADKMTARLQEYREKEGELNV